MAKALPKRALDFERLIKSKTAKEILKRETLKKWGKIFGWNVQSQDSSLQQIADKSK